MSHPRITRKVRAGRPAPTDLPPLQRFDLVAQNTVWRRHIRAIVPYAFAVIVFMVAGAFAVAIVLGGKP